MAKKKELSLGKQDLHFGQIIVDKKLNTRPEAEYGDATDVIRSMATGGFSDNFNVNCFVATPEEAAKEIELRKAILLELETKSERDENAARMLFVLTKLWKDDEGHMIEPVVFNNMAFRRLTNYPQAMVMRRAMEPADRDGDKDASVLTTIPVNIKKYDSEYERILDQLRENGANKQGTKDLSFVTKCEACLPLMKNPRVKESDIVNTLGGARGTGQKVYNLLVVHMRVPEANLLVRGRLDPKDPQYLKLESPKYADWQKISKNGNRPTVEEIEAIFEKEGGNEPKVLEGKAIRKFRDDIAGSQVVRDLFQHVVAADPDELVKIDQYWTPIFKELDRLKAAGLITVAFEALKNIKAVPAPAPEGAEAPAEAQKA